METSVQNPSENDRFRDHLSFENDHGGRRWLYPRVENGPLLRRRTVVAVVLLAALFGGPFLSVDGHPLFLFNVIERRFIFFGVPFWPQDFHLVAIGLITFILFISLFTVVYGRVWCGWACPQTIFMEMVFRKIEIWIEGDHNARKRLDAAPWTNSKITKKVSKHFLFLLISFLISNTFLAYLIGKDELFAIMTDDVRNHLGGFASIVVFTGVFYLVFARLREIVCITICPYGRLQGVLLDKSSVVVAYDHVRGEPRGKIRKGETLKTGDCIDCALCVQVCPTGIDIRNGTQLECINCTACIDACDNVMAKVNRPKGLIRFDSLEGIEKKVPLRFTGRMKAYTAVLLALVGLLTYLLVSRSDLETTVLRAPGQLFQREAGSYVSNLYTIEFVNKTTRSLPVSFRVSYPGARIRLVQPVGQAAPDALTKGVFFILIPEKNLRDSNTKLEVEVVSNGKVIDRIQTSFLGPTH
ncbi:cytochrome c oxidase accessory protein CcoG [Larkinella soli]|uniref:cytochrome c oxidase accessory protein CcoG n=1 Tax=Larkinella soli TaxID=1770527 RepID=UPI000FFB5CBE|nr:cytochrome c oxidase accessory protein CcoG [Larkinella soli]